MNIDCVYVCAVYHVTSVPSKQTNFTGSHIMVYFILSRNGMQCVKRYPFIGTFNRVFSTANSSLKENYWPMFHVSYVSTVCT
jgi:hypothetical protein